MWQTFFVLLLVAAVLVYVVRHYARISRSAGSCCSGCTGCCVEHPVEHCTDHCTETHGSHPPGKLLR